MKFPPDVTYSQGNEPFGTRFQQGTAGWSGADVFPVAPRAPPVANTGVGTGGEQPQTAVSADVTSS